MLGENLQRLTQIEIGDLQFMLRFFSVSFPPTLEENGRYPNANNADGEWTN
jgi:hypothetical protein